MRPSLDIGIMLVGATLALIAFIGLAVLLLVRNHNRRIKHRAEMAELELTRDREVMQAEREAQQQTLQAVGRELHDNLGQLLTVAQMGLDTVLEDQPDDRRIKEVMSTLEQSIEEVRRLGRSLNTDLWEDRSLAEAITAEAVRIERASIAQVRLLLVGEPAPMPADVKIIPGHGEATDLAGLREARQYMADVLEAARQARAAGKTKEQFLASADLPKYKSYDGYGERFKDNCAAAWDDTAP